MAQPSKRFDDYPPVDCNDCERWWISQCDGVPKGSHRQCNSFVATRGIVLPEKIKALEERTRSLELHLTTLYGVNIIWTIAYIMGWL